MAHPVTAEAKSKSKADKSHGNTALGPSEFGSPIQSGASAGMPRFLGMHLQRKLAVGSVDDPLEREADQVAEAVMSAGALDSSSSAYRAMRGVSHDSGGARPGVQRKCACGGAAAGECEACAEKSQGGVSPDAVVQRRTSGDGGGGGTSEAPPIVHEVLRSPGRSLDPATRATMEPRLGHDFSQVRVHTDDKAAESARAVKAKAYTVDHNVVFDSGEYAPGSAAGQRLLGHELTHVVQQSQSRGEGAQTLRRTPQDLYTPTFDTEEHRRYGMAPLTASSEMSALARTRKGESAITPAAALKDFTERFPFLQPLAVAYRSIVEEVLNPDVADFKTSRRVDTEVNRSQAATKAYAYSLPKDVTSLIEMGKVESLSYNQARSETIWGGWILSEAPIPVPSSSLAESDGRTYLRGVWEKFKQNPVFLAMDGWAYPAIRLYISDGMNDWEIRRSGKQLEMEDLLSIPSIQQEYEDQEKHGPKRAGLGNSLLEVQSGLKGARFLLEDQLKTDREAAPGVVPISKHLGKGGAAFGWLVEEFQDWSNEPDGPAKGPAFSKLMDGYDDIKKMIGGGPGEAFSQLADAYEQQVYSEIWQKKYQLTQDSDTHLTDEEKNQAHTEGWARALKDWVSAPDVLPDDSMFTRVEEAAARASQYLEKGDLQSAAAYLGVALEVENRIAARIDRYKTRVTSGAGSAIETLSHIETGSKIFLAVASGAEFGLLGGAAFDAGFTFATSVASGDTVTSAMGQAGKAFLTDMVFGKISSAMSAQLLSRGWSPFFAHAVANVAAMPYVKAAEIMYQKALDPDSPLPDLTKLPEESFESAVFGMLISAGHDLAGIGAKPTDPLADSPAGGSKTPAVPDDPVQLRELARKQAQAERELGKASAQGAVTPEERDVLASGVRKNGPELDPKEALTERQIAHRSVGEPINEPPFTVKYKVPNGHEVKETPQGDVFERCSFECGIYDGKGNRIGTKQVEVGPPPRRQPAPERMPIVAEYTSRRQTNRGANYRISGDAAQFRESRRSGFHVYEYLNADGELLYVGKSGGVKKPDANWIKRLQDSHINTDWIPDAVRVRVHYDLTEQEMWALEEVLIPTAVHKDANVKPGEYSWKFEGNALDANSASALKRPSAIFAIYASPVQ